MRPCVTRLASVAVWNLEVVELALLRSLMGVITQAVS